MPPKKYHVVWTAFGGDDLVSAGRDGIVNHGPTGMVVKAPRRFKDETPATGYRDTDTSVLSSPDGIFHPLMKESLQDVLDHVDHVGNGCTYDDYTAARWLIQIASAAAWLESIDYFHGDLRPPNILLDSEGHVKMCDFGNMTRRGEMNHGATIPYCKAYKACPANEQYAIGSLMYALFTGHELLHDIDDYRIKHKMLRSGGLPPVENLRAGDVMWGCWAGRYDTLEQLHGVLLVEMGLGLDYNNPAVCLTPKECATKAAECEAWGNKKRAWLEECRQRNAKRNLEVTD